MDVGAAARSVPVVDLAILAGLFGWFILGVMQGSIRRILGIISLAGEGMAAGRATRTKL